MEPNAEILADIHRILAVVTVMAVISAALIWLEICVWVCRGLSEWVFYIMTSNTFSRYFLKE